MCAFEPVLELLRNLGVHRIAGRAAGKPVPLARNSLAQHGGEAGVLDGWEEHESRFSGDTVS
jgi:hypothetical protein